MNLNHLSIKSAEAPESQTPEWVWRRAMELASQVLGQESLPKKYSGKNALETAQLLLRLGFAEVAASCFHVAESCGLPPGEWVQSRLGLIRAQWLAGHETEALSLVEATWRYMQERPEVRCELTWLKQRWQMLKHSDLNVLLKGDQEKLYLVYPYCIEARLWSLIYTGKDLAISQNSQSMDQKQSALVADFWPQFFRIITEMKPKKDSLAKGLITLLGRKSALASIEEELLCFFVSARSLNLCGYQKFAELAEAAYRALSLTLTNGCNPARFGAAKPSLNAHDSAA